MIRDMISVRNFISLVAVILSVLLIMFFYIANWLGKAGDAYTSYAPVAVEHSQ